MAFPTNTAGNIDNANRANAANPGTGWSWPVWNGDSPPAIASNAFKAPASGYAQAYRTGLNIGDCECFFFVPSSPGSYYQAYARIQTANLPGSTNPSYYAFGPDSGTMATYRVSGGVGTQIGSSASITPASGDGYGIECIGTAIAGYSYRSSTWTKRGNGTDSTYATGSIGFEFNNGEVVDDFSGGSPVSGTTFYAIKSYIYGYGSMNGHTSLLKFLTAKPESNSYIRGYITNQKSIMGNLVNKGEIKATASLGLPSRTVLQGQEVLQSNTVLNKGIKSSIFAESKLTGVMGQLKAIQTRIYADSTVRNNLVKISFLKSIIEGSGLVKGSTTLSKSIGTYIQVVNQVANQFGVVKQIKAQIQGDSSIKSTLGKMSGIKSIIEGRSEVTGRIGLFTGTTFLAIKSTIFGNSDLKSTLGRTSGISSSIQGNSFIQSTLSQTKGIKSVIYGSNESTGRLGLFTGTLLKAIKSTIEGNGAIRSTLGKTSSIVSKIEASSSIQSSAGQAKGIKATIVSTSQLTANMVKALPSATRIFAKNEVKAVFSVSKSVKATIEAGSKLTGSISKNSWLKAVIQIGSYLKGTLILRAAITDPPPIASLVEIDKPVAEMAYLNRPIAEIAEIDRPIATIFKDLLP